MVEVLPHEPASVRVAVLPFLHGARWEHFRVHLLRAVALRDLGDGQAEPVPDGDGGEPVQRGDVDGLLKNLRGEAFRLRDAPRLAGVLACGDDFRKTRMHGLLGNAG